MSDAYGLPDASQLVARFGHDGPVSVGVEEEYMLLDPATLDLAPRAAELLEGSARSLGARLELPASQVEMATAPCGSLAQAAEQILNGRVALAHQVRGEVLLAGSGMHPFAAAAGELNRSPRYERLHGEYGWVAQRQLVCGMHVHVRLGGGAERALGAYNALRAYLPDLAALGANAPYYQGVDTGMASVRPLVGAMLPRQGVPPQLASWEHYARELTWAQAGGRVQSAREWWWELRPHPAFGTIEVRVLDAQTNGHQAAALAALVASLVVWLAQRHDAADLPPAAETWRIAENRWSAARHGLDAMMVDVHTGARVPVRDRLYELIERLEPAAATLDALDLLARARGMVEVNGALRQRQVGDQRQARGLTEWLARSFLDSAAG